MCGCETLLVNFHSSPPSVLRSFFLLSRVSIFCFFVSLPFSFPFHLFIYFSCSLSPLPSLPLSISLYFSLSFPLLSTFFIVSDSTRLVPLYSLARDHFQRQPAQHVFRSLYESEPATIVTSTQVSRAARFSAPNALHQRTGNKREPAHAALHKDTSTAGLDYSYLADENNRQRDLTMPALST